MLFYASPEFDYFLKYGEKNENPGINTDPVDLFYGV